MSDKSAPMNPTPKGKAYCDVRGTSCTYNKDNVCINCGRPKGWRKPKTARQRALEALGGPDHDIERALRDD